MPKDYQAIAKQVFDIEAEAILNLKTKLMMILMAVLTPLLIRKAAWSSVAWVNQD
jgi:hypothetical protein